MATTICASRDMILRIEVQDMKPRYSHSRDQKKRITAYVKSVENTSGLHIAFCVKEHRIAEFTIKGGESVSKEIMKSVREYLQGEICSPGASKKYDLPVTYLPHLHVRQVKPSHEAWKEMTTENQRDLQAHAMPTVPLTIDALEKHDSKNTSGPMELRQFACPDCHKAWWRTVLKTKPVSRCKGQMCGGQKYDPVPKNREFGIGRFTCPNGSCRRTFFGHCEAMDELFCRKCKTPAKPYIHPKWIKRVKKMKKLNPNAKSFKPKKPAYRPAMPPRREDLGPKFEPVSDFTAEHNIPSGLTHGFGAMGIGSPPSTGNMGRGNPPSTGNMGQGNPPSTGNMGRVNPPQGEMPRGQKRKIFNPSTRHTSTGSTISTIISQCDFEKTGMEVDLDFDDDIDECAVGVCRFECDCDNEYTVLCRMVDTAICFDCRRDNSPLGWAPPREIDHKTDKQHSCSRCPENGECPNVQDARFAMQ